MKSLSILTLNPPGSQVTVDKPSAPTATSSSNSTSTEWTLTESARHFATVWSSAVACVGEHEWLLADMEGNLVVLRRNVNGVTAEDRKRLEMIAEYRLGEVVNKIVPILPPGSAAAKAAALTKKTRTTLIANEKNTSTTNGTRLACTGPIVTPTAFLATVEGGVYLHANISPAFLDPLMRLQAALASRIKAPGHMPWARYRAVRTEVREGEESFRWVDGEVVEGVLGLTDDDGEAILAEVVAEVNAGLGISNGKGEVTVQEIRGWAEALRRLY
jgi:DNA damage-binding protein 1